MKIPALVSPSTQDAIEKKSGDIFLRPAEGLVARLYNNRAMTEQAASESRSLYLSGIVSFLAGVVFASAASALILGLLPRAINPLPLRIHLIGTGSVLAIPVPFCLWKAYDLCKEAGKVTQNVHLENLDEFTASVREDSDGMGHILGRLEQPQHKEDLCRFWKELTGIDLQADKATT
jgi:hypothetical protein